MKTLEYKTTDNKSVVQWKQTVKVLPCTFQCKVAAQSRSCIRDYAVYVIVKLMMWLCIVSDEIVWALLIHHLLGKGAKQSLASS